MDELLKLLLEKGFDVTPVLDGEYHRFDRGGKILAGWFKGIEVRDAHDQVLFQEAEFGDWYTRERHSWAGGKNSSNMTSEQLAELAFKRKELAEKTRAEKLKRQEMAAADARRLYASALAGTETHPYIVRKQVDPGEHPRLLGDKFCIPVLVKDEDGGRSISSLQLIAADGSKKFLSGGRLDRGFTWWCLPEYKLVNFETLYMCEGYATAASVGMAVRAPVLVCFNTANMVKLAQKLPVQAQQVVICADNDNKKEGENPGLEAADQAARALRDQGIPVRVVAPQASAGTACDWNDFHVANGLDKLRIALVGAPKDSGSVQAPAETAAGEQKTVPEPVPPPSTRALLPPLSAFKQVKIRKTPEGEVIPPTQLEAVDCLREGFGDLLMREGKNVLAWAGTHWEEQDPIDFKFYVKRAVMKILHGKSTEKQTNDIYALYLGYLATPPRGQSFYRQDPRLANFEDGTLVVTRGKADPGAGADVGQTHAAYQARFRPHQRADLCTWVLPYKYAMDRGRNPLFDSWLERCFEGDADRDGKIRALKQIGGACLVSLFPRYVFLYGPGGTGKSTFAKLCMRLLSPANVCSVEPKDQGGSFGKEIMVGKQANIVTDISGAKIDSALFKRGEDRVPEYINRKNRGAVMGFLPALNVFCANPNQLPKGIDTESSAMNRRVTIVEFSRSLVEDGKYTRDFDELIWESGPGAVLQFCLDGLADLCASGGLYFNPESGHTRLQRWKDSESLTAQFLEALAHGEIEGFVLDPGARVQRNKLGVQVASWVGGKPTPRQIGQVFQELEARGHCLKIVNGTRYVVGIGVKGDAGAGDQGAGVQGGSRF